ncbi:MAG: hypothetical protein ACLQT7_00840 [Candidatus Dormibacteria bacterium]
MTLLASLTLALAWMWPGLFAGHDTIVGNATDPSLWIWDLKWVPFALAHHLNPLVTNYLHYPSGMNLMWNASIIFPALVLAPVTNLFGPIVSYNVVAVLGVGLSAWCAFLAARRYTSGWLPAAACGLLYGFSPFMESQILGHAQLFIAVFPPLLIIFADEILARQRRPAPLMGILLGVAAAAQLLTGEELLAMSAVMAIPALVTLAIIRRDQVLRRLRYAARAAGWALATFLLLGGYPLYVQFLGPQVVHGALNEIGVYVASLASFVEPSQRELISGSALVSDSSVYVGVPMLLLAVFVVAWLRRWVLVMVAAVTLVSAMVFSLGGHLLLHGVPSGIVLPWDVVDHLPVFDNILPVRLMVFAYLALGILIALWLDATRPRGRRWEVGGAVLAAAALLPLIPALPVPPGDFTVPSFFTDGSAQRLSPTGAVLFTPYDSPVSQAWQALSGMAFHTASGEVYVPGPGGNMLGPDLGVLGNELNRLDSQQVPAPTAIPAPERVTFLGDLRASDVTSVVVGPSAGRSQIVQLFTELLGTPGVSTGGVIVWFDVHP